MSMPYHSVGFRLQSESRTIFRVGTPDNDNEQSFAFGIVLDTRIRVYCHGLERGMQTFNNMHDEWMGEPRCQDDGWMLLLIIVPSDTSIHGSGSSKRC